MAFHSYAILNLTNLLAITVQIFEAFPVDTCVAQRQSDGNAFSLKFGIDDDTDPLVTYCFGSTDCGASNSKLKSAATSLFSGRLSPSQLTNKRILPTN